MAKIYKVKDYDWSNLSNISSRLKKTKKENVALEVFERFENELIKCYKEFSKGYSSNKSIYKFSDYCTAIYYQSHETSYTILEKFLLSLKLEDLIINFGHYDHNGHNGGLLKTIVKFDNLFNKIYNKILNCKFLNEKILYVGFLMYYVKEFEIKEYYHKIKDAVINLFKSLTTSIIKNLHSSRYLDAYLLNQFPSGSNENFFDIFINFITYNDDCFIDLRRIFLHWKNNSNASYLAFNKECSDFLNNNKSYLDKYKNGYILKKSTSKWFKFQGV